AATISVADGVRLTTRGGPASDDRVGLHPTTRKKSNVVQIPWRNAPRELAWFPQTCPHPPATVGNHAGFGAEFDVIHNQPRRVITGCPLPTHTIPGML